MGVCHTKSDSQQNRNHSQSYNQHPGQKQNKHVQKPHKVEKPKKEIKAKKFLLYYPVTEEESKRILSFDQIEATTGVLGRGVYLYDDFKEAKHAGKLKDKKTVILQVEVKSYSPKTRGWEEGGEYGHDFGYDGRKNYCAYNKKSVTIKKKVDCFKIKNVNLVNNRIKVHRSHSSSSSEEKKDDGY